jgi:hypothetical protein
LLVEGVNWVLPKLRQSWWWWWLSSSLKMFEDTSSSSSSSTGRIATRLRPVTRSWGVSQAALGLYGTLLDAAMAGMTIGFRKRLDNNHWLIMCCLWSFGFQKTRGINQSWQIGALIIWAIYL